MNRGNIASVASASSFVGSILNLLVSVIRLPEYPWFLTSISGLVTLFAAIFLYWNHQNRVLWGGIIFLYSNLGFIAFGLSPETHLLPYGFGALTLGIIGGALGLSQK
jgi:hypothetical protein